MKLIIFLLALYACLGSIIVETEYGQVRGIEYSTHNAFLGIPFMAPPVKDLRFKPPKAPTPWRPNVYDATKPKPACPQHCILPKDTCPLEYSEDCIYLNVFTPKNVTSNDRLPVYVYIHGGNFQQGGPNIPLFDGRSIAQRGVITVFISYRLGALGWLTQTDAGLKGNLGLMDQRFALEWVQRNIHNFGGDKDKVTLGGQSAGGHSTAAHMISPKSKGLFRQAIIESMPVSLPFRTLESATAMGKRFFQYLNCEDVECLRTKSTDDIIKAQLAAGKAPNNTNEPLVYFQPWAPVTDGDEIPFNVMDAFERGAYAKVPVIFGDVEDEALIFVMRGFPDYINDVMYIGAVVTIFKGARLQVLYWYPPTPRFGDKRPAMSVLGSDYIFFAPERWLMNQMQKHNTQNHGIYYYRFNHSFSFDGWGPGYEYCRPKSCHGVNVPFVFNSAPQFNQEEKDLSQQVMDYYTNFIKNGNPNQGAPVKVEWPVFKMDTQQYMFFRTPQIRIDKFYKQKYMDFWDSVGYKFGIGNAENVNLLN